MEDQTRSLSEVAGLMGVSERTVRRWIKAGRLKAYKPGRDYRIPETGLRTFIEESEISPKDQAPLQLELKEQSGADEEQRLINALARVVEVVMERWQVYIDGLPEQPAAEKWQQEVERIKELIIDATKLRKVIEDHYDVLAPYADAIATEETIPEPLRGDVMVLEHALYGIDSYLIPKAREWASRFEETRQLENIDSESSEWATKERIPETDTAQQDV